MITQQIIDTMPIISIPEGMTKERFTEILTRCLEIKCTFLCVRMCLLHSEEFISTQEIDEIEECIKESIFYCNTLDGFLFSLHNLDKSEIDSHNVLRDIWIKKNITHYS